MNDAGGDDDHYGGVLASKGNIHNDVFIIENEPSRADLVFPCPTKLSLATFATEI